MKRMGSRRWVGGLVAAGLVAAGLVAETTQAANYTNTASGNWSVAGSWSSSPTPPPVSGTNNIYFNNSATDNSFNDVADPFALNVLMFLKASSVNLSGSALTFTNNGATMPQVYQNVAIGNSIANNITLSTSMTFYVNSGTLTNTGVISGSGSLTKTGSTTLYLQGSNTYAGATTVSAGTLNLTNANGAIVSPAVTLNGGKLVLDNTGAVGNNNNNRVPDATTVSLTLGGELALVGNGTSGNTTESLGALTVDQGGGIITVGGSGAGTLQTLTPSSFTRANSGTVLVRGDSLGQAATAAGRLTLTDTSGLTFVGATTANGATPGTAKDVKIVPYMVGDATAAGTGSGVVTYDTAGGLRALGSSEYTTLIAGYTTAASHENVKGAAVTLANSVVVNSLTFASAVTLGGNTTTLGIDSGTIVANSAATLANTISLITLGNNSTCNEGNIYNTANLTNNSPLTVTGGGGVTKAGNGTLILAASNLYTGVTTVNDGKLQIGNAGTSGALAGGLTLGSGTTLAYNRTDSSAPIAGAVTGLGGNITVNSGTLTLNSANLTAGSVNAFGLLTVAAGCKLVINGAENSTNTSVAPSMGAYAKLELGGGVNSFTNTFWTGSWALYVTGGTNSVPGSLLSIGGNSSTYDYVGIPAGKLSVSGIPMGGSNSVGVVDICGGTFELAGGGGGVAIQIGHGGVGVFNQTSGRSAMDNNGTIVVGSRYAGRGEFNLSGGTVGGTGSSSGYNLTIANTTTNTGIVNLNGGVFYINTFNNSANITNAFLNFNGGTLAATVANKIFSPSNATMTIYSGGATIDDGGYAVTISAPLLAPTGKGVTALPALPGGTLAGYIGSPYVQISGGSGTGATAVAQFDYTTGNVTGLVITCSGFGYQAGDSVSVTLKSGGVADNALGSATIGDITSGGLTKIGSGTLTLSGTNTYTGVTTVSNGKLVVSSTNALAGTTGINLTGGTLVATNVPGAFHITPNSTVSVAAGSSFLVTNLVVDAGATVSPGGSVAIATNTFGTTTSHTLTIDGTYEVNLSNDGSGRCDHLIAAGNLILTNMTLSFPNTSTYDPGMNYVIAICSNTLTKPTAVRVLPASQEGKWLLRYSDDNKQVILRRASAGAMLIVY